MKQNIFEILKFRPYLFFVVSTLFSNIGTGMQVIANSWLILDISGQVSSIAIFLMCYTLPGIFLSPLTGIIVDKIDRRWLAISMDIYRGLILLTIFVLWHLGSLLTWHLYLMGILIAIGDQIYSPAAAAMIREVVKKDMLLSANASTSIAMQVGALIGAGFAGLIIAVSSAIDIMWINALSFVVSSFLLNFVRKGYKSPSTNISKVKGYKKYFSQLTDGIRYIVDNTSIIPMYILIFCITATVRTINVLLAPFAKDVLAVGSVGFGYIDASFALGAILGGLLLPNIYNKFNFNKTVVLLMGMLSCGLIGFSLSNKLIIAMLFFFLIGASVNVKIVCLTLVQQIVSLDYQGRVHSTFNAIFSVLTFGLYFLMGYLGDLISLRWLYSFQGIIVIVVVILVLNSKSVCVKAVKNEKKLPV
ncbi:MFS transporter [Sporosarcina sp.]|uniref:MFS transporter n=1 Tax=Sporosarcina sp. TaxID=49982 RepID=UPI00262141CB|nr:MFS transporter [Sporosarcina sp.]